VFVHQRLAQVLAGDMSIYCSNDHFALYPDVLLCSVARLTLQEKFYQQIGLMQFQKCLVSSEDGQDTDIE